MTDLLIVRAAEISPCGKYRYRLERWWGNGPLLPFIMLNPSTADAYIDDPTIRRCMGFARREKYDGIVVGNQYALRATNPSDLWAAVRSSGIRAALGDNWRALAEIEDEACRAGVPVVLAWGAIPPSATTTSFRRAPTVCLGKTAGGMPRHPLYVRADQPLEPWP
jgi:hypothetical protein